MSAYKSLGPIGKILRDSLQEKIVENMRARFNNDLIPKVMENLMKIYDGELAAEAPEEDPANPGFARRFFEAAIREDLIGSLNDAENRGFGFSVGNTDTFNYNHHNQSYLKFGIAPGTGESRPLDWLIFYLEGFIGEYIFITREEYELLKPDAGEIGWFGKGFLLPVGAYKGRSMDKLGIPFRKHPFSGKKPAHIFERAIEGLEEEIDILAELAISDAIKEMTGQ